MQLSPRLRWKLERYRREFRERVDGFRSVLRDSMEKQKVCPACRALVSAGESRCPFCGERLGATDRVGIRRLVGGLLPEGPRYSMMLLGANFLMFGISLFASMRAGIGLDSLLGGMPAPILVALGARDYTVAYGEWWRLLTAIFLHGGLVHLLFNTWVLFDVGPAVEEMYGGTRFLVLYLVAGIAGSFASFWWHPFAIMVGASGALFGLIGVMIAYGYRHRTSLAQQVRAMYVRWAIYGLAFGFIVPGIDNAAHIGGLLAGIGFGALVSDTPVFSRTGIVAWRMAAYAALLVVGASFLIVAVRYPLR